MESQGLNPKPIVIEAIPAAESFPILRNFVTTRQTPMQMNANEVESLVKNEEKYKDAIPRK
jgi:hypothetical protein